MTATRHAPSKSSRVSRNLLVSAGVLVVAIIAALLGTGTSYALWNGRADIAGGTVVSGTTGITASTITGLDLSRLGPGQTVVTSSPVGLTNIGSTKLSTTVATTAVTGSATLASELSVTLIPSANCSPGMTGGTTGRLAAFTSTAAPIIIESGQSVPVCLTVTMDLDAPVSVKNLATGFTLTVTGRQVR